MKAQTPQEAATEQTIRKLYFLANATAKDPFGFVAVFGNGGYYYDASAVDKYYGQDIGLTVDNYATAFPHTAEARAIAEDDRMVRGGYESYELATWPIADRQNSYRPNLQGVMTR